MKLDPRRMLVGLAVAGTLVVAPPAVSYAVGAVDTRIASRPEETVERTEWVAGSGSLTDVRQDDNDNDAVDNDNAADNDNAVDNDNDDGTGNDNGSDPAPDGAPNPNPNDPNNNGDGDSGNNGADSNNGDDSNNGGGSGDSSSGVE